MLSRNDLWHNTPQSPGLFFVLPEALSAEIFASVVDVLRRNAAHVENEAGVGQYWDAIRRRLDGSWRWDDVVPRYTGKFETVEESRARKQTLHIVPNIISRRGYPCFVVDDIGYLLEVFNPTNELALPYPGAGEPVLAVLLHNRLPPSVRTNLPLRDRLVEIESFYRVVAGLVSALQPSRVCGGTFLVRAVTAYTSTQRPLSSEMSPWELLWTLDVMDTKRAAGVERPRIDKHFIKCLDLSNRLLLQVRRGFDYALAPEYVSAARLLVMTAVTEIGDL